MKKISIFLLIGLFLIVSISLAQNTEPVAYISYLEGAVYLNFGNAQINMILMTADELRTENGRTEVCLNGNYFRLDRYTKVIFASLEENSILLRIKSGNVYIRAKDEIAIQTPHKQNNLAAGLYRIDVKTNKTNIYSNPKVIDDNFDRFNSKRENEINRPLNTVVRYYGFYDYYGWRWRIFYRNLYLLNIYSWYSWYWNPFWVSFWNPIWYSSYYYSGFYRPNRNYYHSGFYRQNSRIKTVIHKKQLQRRIPHIKSRRYINSRSYYKPKSTIYRHIRHVLKFSKYLSRSYHSTIKKRIIKKRK